MIHDKEPNWEGSNRVTHLVSIDVVPEAGPLDLGATVVLPHVWVFGLGGGSKGVKIFLLLHHNSHGHVDTSLLPRVFFGPTFGNFVQGVLESL